MTTQLQSINIIIYYYYKALKTIYEGAVVPNLTHGAPIWVEAIRKDKNLTKYKRIQRLTNTKIAKAYRTVSYGASCVIAGVGPIQITIVQKVQTYVATKTNDLEYDAPLEVRYWRHSAELAIVHEERTVLPYILKSNPHPNLIRTSFCRFLKRKKKS